MSRPLTSLMMFGTKDHGFYTEIFISFFYDIINSQYYVKLKRIWGDQVSAAYCVVIPDNLPSAERIKLMNPMFDIEVYDKENALKCLDEILELDSKNRQSQRIASQRSDLTKENMATALSNVVGDYLKLDDISGFSDLLSEDCKEMFTEYTLLKPYEVFSDLGLDNWKLNYYPLTEEFEIVNQTSSYIFTEIEDLPEKLIEQLKKENAFEGIEQRVYISYPETQDDC